MAVVTPLTALEAVNLILRNSGEAPVTAITDILESTQANETLLEVSRDLQNEGWYFNTEQMTLSPDGDGYIQLPNNTLSVTTVEEDADTPVVMRGTRLYRLTAFDTGYVWTAAVKVSLVLGLDFADLPASARRYIAAKAARTYQVREQSDQLSLQEDTEEEKKAYYDLVAEDMRRSPCNLLSNPDIRRVVATGYHGRLHQGAFR